MKKNKKISTFINHFYIDSFALGIGIRYIIDPVGLNNKFNLGL